MPPRGGAVAIVGADAMGKANDEEVRGDAEEVTQRRSESSRSGCRMISVQDGMRGRLYISRTGYKKQAEGRSSRSLNEKR